ncbi:MAG: histidine--tRNA ligase [Candidatus Verstraetearchaeota archaeon]|jgi:histidyl-tRNA synthetase|nr:histidine--tRNA ligase [Candidatus Verstraetearchaeota archaeon]
MSEGGFKVLRGLRDLLPEDVEKLKYVSSVIREIFKLYGYQEIITPTIEAFSLFEKKAGEELRHRMYKFTDLGGREVALRPEMTPSVARFYINHMLSHQKPIRLGYIANCFRYDEPQHGRYREFWQGGFELIGSSNPEADVEILNIANTLMKRLKFSDYYLKLNHVGIIKGILTYEKVPENIQNRVLGLFDKTRYDEAMYLLKSSNVTDECLNNIKEVISLRGSDVNQIINSAEQYIRKYPLAMEALSNLKEILILLDKSELKIPILLDLGFARGLEYYTGIIFECFSSKNNKLALGGGGRYDNLIELFGGPPTPAVGYAPGIDRIILALTEEKIELNIEKHKKVIVISLSREFIHHAIKVASILRESGIPTEVEIMGRDLKKALSYANSRNFDYAIIIGSIEVKEGKITLKDLNKGEQYKVSIEETINMIKTLNNK